MATGGAPDVAIIGGGIVGVAAAAELAAAGASVRLYERGELAAGASGRNSGAVWQPLDPVLDVLYVESLARYRRLEDELAELAPPDPRDPAAISFHLDATPAGILHLAEDADALRRTASSLATSHPHLGATFLDEAAVRAAEPSVAPGLAACRVDIGFPVAPAAATRAFGALARARGATMLTTVDARVALAGDRAVGVLVGDRVEPAGCVIVAAGPWTPELIDPSGAWRPIRAWWGVVVEVELPEPPRHILEQVAIEEDDPHDDLELVASFVDFSLVTVAGRSSLGSTFLPAEPDPAAWVEQLRTGGAAFVPAIARAPVRGVRACARPLARDGRPLVGAVPWLDGLFVAAGHGPWGISTGPASGAHVARLALGDGGAVPEAIRSEVDPSRFGRPGA